VTARIDEGELVVAVRDDGIGLGASTPADTPSPGQGLASMHERAALLGGTVRVAPGPAGGTEVVLSIPAHALI
jgi:signal transduction histidine kinase